MDDTGPWFPETNAVFIRNRSQKIIDLGIYIIGFLKIGGGSGFSFADLLADRAGVALADAAMGPAAASIQERMRNSAGESVYMPGLSRLPEGLMELEFKASYDDLDSATYALVNSEIERRIVNCPLYRPGLGQGQGWP